jgi:hypothetical protein
VPPTDPNATLAAAAEPIPDTQPDAKQDTAADTQTGTVDWEKRYKELQSHTARQIDTLRRQVEVSSPDDDEPAPDPVETPEPQGQPSARLTRDSWQLAESIYGGEAIDAYGRAATLLERAQTPADYVAAFEAYHQRRLEGAAPKQAAAQAPAQGEPQQPRVESNRSDTSPRNELDQEAEAALAKGDSRGFFLAQLRKIRGE